MLQEGLDRLLSQNAGAHTKFEEAIALDDGLAMAYGGLAVWYMQRAQPVEARSNIQRALALAAGITRRERQQLETSTSGSRGRAARRWRCSSSTWQRFRVTLC